MSNTCVVGFCGLCEQTINEGEPLMSCGGCGSIAHRHCRIALGHCPDSECATWTPRSVEGYWNWVHGLVQEPMASSEGRLLTVIALVVMAASIGGGFWSVWGWLPSGSYPRIVLAAPFIAVGLATFYGFSYLVYRLKRPALA